MNNKFVFGNLEFGKRVYKKPTASIILIGKILEAFTLKSGKKNVFTDDVILCVENPKQLIDKLFFFFF